jgi:hypothetical protein
MATAVTGAASVVTSLVQSAVGDGNVAGWATPVLLATALFFGRKWVNRIDKKLESECDRNQRNYDALVKINTVLGRLSHDCPYLNGGKCDDAGTTEGAT